MEIIAGGTVFDGTGAPRRLADVGVEGDTIVAVGDLSAAEGHRLDARGLFVAPGFIDLHTHSDATLLRNPHMSSTVQQGVTTEVAGNCGMQVGLALRTPEFALENRFVHEGVTWSSLAEFLSLIEEQGTAANVAFLAGHGTLRKRVMGWSTHPPEPDELRRMRALLRQAMEEGAFGLSSGLEYTPARFAPTGELIELAHEVADFGGIYATHLRDEADGLVDSVEEALLVAREAGVALELSHHKAEGKRNWGTVERTLALVDQARENGLDVACDVYPYTAFMTGLGVRTLPDWAHDGSVEQIAERLRDPEYRARVLADMCRLPIDWSLIQIAVSRHDRSLQGRSLTDIAEERGLSPQEAVLDILATEGGMVTGINFAIGEEDMQRVMRYEHSSIGSDSATRDADGPFADDRVHPRGFGTFPRVLGRYVSQEHLLTWEQAIRKMTGLPASRIGLRHRGVLQPGAQADIVVFDPEAVIDHATYAEPHHFPAGIRHVWVNGVPVLRNGKETGKLPGRVLRRGGGS